MVADTVLWKLNVHTHVHNSKTLVPMLNQTNSFLTLWHYMFADHLVLLHLPPVWKKLCGYPQYWCWSVVCLCCSAVYVVLLFICVSLLLFVLLIMLFCCLFVLFCCLFVFLCCCLFCSVVYVVLLFMLFCCLWCSVVYLCCSVVICVVLCIVCV